MLSPEYLTMKRLDLVTSNDLELKLGEALARRELPDCFLYVGEAGTQNWLNLDHSEDFPVATSLTRLLSENASRIARRLSGSATLLSVGVGDGMKERLLLKAMMRRGLPGYVAVDVSSQMVDEALRSVADLSIEATGITGFCEDLPMLLRHARPPCVVALLGNNFCNYEPDALLNRVAGELGPDDLLLFDAHILPEGAAEDKAWRRSVETAYRSVPNVRFNLGPLLSHGMNPDACSFRLELLPVDTPHGPVLRTCKWIDVLCDASVRVGDTTVEFAAGETLSMGFTYKYTAAQIDGYLQRHGFGTLERFVSASGDNLLVLVRPFCPRGER